MEKPLNPNFEYALTYLFLLWRHEWFPGKYAARKISIKANPGLGLRIFQKFNSDNHLSWSSLQDTESELLIVYFITALNQDIVLTILKSSTFGDSHSPVGFRWIQFQR